MLSQVQISEVKESFADQKLLDSSISVVTTLVPVMIAVCQLPFMYLTWKMSQDFGWDIYKDLGADRKIKRMFFKYQSECGLLLACTTSALVGTRRADVGCAAVFLCICKCAPPSARSN